MPGIFLSVYSMQVASLSFIKLKMSFPYQKTCEMTKVLLSWQLRLICHVTCIINVVQSARWNCLLIIMANDTHLRQYPALFLEPISSLLNCSLLWPPSQTQPYMVRENWNGESRKFAGRWAKKSGVLWRVMPGQDMDFGVLPILKLGF